ncbi:helix-turn-helix domain-containing protein (plasmid) [Neorhizobium galegae]|nr:helix-turn-helix domain-containing protein [Neorhizobium galegae]
MDASVKQKAAGKDLRSRGAGIQSLEKGLKVLTAIQHAGRAMRLNDIAAAAGMTPSMAHGYLVSLVRTGFVAQDRLSGLYDLGDAALQLGLASLSRTDFLSLARAAISQLAAGTRRDGDAGGVERRCACRGRQDRGPLRQRLRDQGRLACPPVADGDRTGLHGQPARS